VYLEKFGADATIMGLLFSVISFWSPLTECLVGHLQDREVLKRCFPVERWGRRALSLATHCVIAAVAASAVYMPPSNATGPLEVWFVLVLMLSYWGASSCVIAFEAARQVFGGELPHYTQLMQDEASKLGANAVISLRLSSTNIAVNTPGPR
ncbi:unnamed protein product, partial [Symbiodinium sp. CCMP2456]